MRVPGTRTGHGAVVVRQGYDDRDHEERYGHDQRQAHAHVARPRDAYEQVTHHLDHIAALQYPPLYTHVAVA